jgi:hypothetical protein
LWLLIGIKVCGSSSRLLLTIANGTRGVSRHATSRIHDYARQLLEVHGAQAIVEAAQKATKFEREGENDQAQTWRQIEVALKLMRGPHQK